MAVADFFAEIGICTAQARLSSRPVSVEVSFVVVAPATRAATIVASVKVDALDDRTCSLAVVLRAEEEDVELANGRLTKAWLSTDTQADVEIPRAAFLLLARCSCTGGG
uniref:Thioesterase domain-containing protein n=1 Tax=Zooxanthella nutricula TaxID=1333877 RepID=A0A7S2QFI2_9DINO